MIRLVRRLWRLSSLMLLAFVLSSCFGFGEFQAPAEIVSYGAQTGAGSSGAHTILRGDTVYSIARRYNLPVRDLIATNHLSAPYVLSTGARLKLPPPHEYKAREGDTLSRVARLFDVSVSETARLNGIRSPYLLKAGQVLRLPSSQPALLEEGRSASLLSPQPYEPINQMRPVGIVGQVQSEPLSPFPVSSGSVLVDPPHMQQEKSRQGQDFGAKVMARAAEQERARQKIEKDRQRKMAAISSKNKQNQEDRSAVVPSSTGLSEVAPQIVPSVPKRSSSSRFMRPVEGKIVSIFGPKADGLHNDGINIKAPRGSSVRSAENGVVAYAGDGLGGYGNLVLIRHADRYITAYAHMDKILVKKGDVVKVGQSVGTVGSSGNVDSPQLHFEVRRGTQALDPQRYL